MSAASHLLTIFALISSGWALLDPVPIILIKSAVTYSRNAFTEAHRETKTKPAPINGVIELASLSQSCFRYESTKYRYRLCPFANITQEEIGANWKPFSALIGVWSGEWLIEDNTFKAMMYKDGNSCGNFNRSAQVFFSCGQNNSLINVVETSQCVYEMIFETGLACNADVFRVYPRLEESLQRKWDLIETKYAVKLLTKEGHAEELKDLFVEAGLSQPARRKEAVFTNLTECNLKYNELRNRIHH